LPGAAGLSDGALDEKRATINEWVEEFMKAQPVQSRKGRSRTHDDLIADRKPIRPDQIELA
jgi:hypothetical protein